MDCKDIILVLCLSCSLSFAVQHTPQVAFMCNKPAVYLTESGWVQDTSTDCLSTPRDILNFCRKVFPDRDIRNVVEGSSLVTIDNWCGFDAQRCHQHNSHRVRPFRCLVGAFQSDALLVPEHCTFDHIHGDRCARYMDWNQTAFEACRGKKERLESFAMLQPCQPQVDVFSGVEFVCCPMKSGSFAVVDDSDLFDDGSNDGQGNVEFWKPKPQIGTKDAKLPPLLDDDVMAPPPKARPDPRNIVDDVYHKYLLEDHNDKYFNEHEYFLKAKGDMQREHHRKVSNMMSDWGAARQRVAEMKVIDPKGADRLEQEITDRFQRTYEALEQQGVEEKRQLSAIHQQRVQTELNTKKRSAMEKYMDTLTQVHPDAEQIERALRHYIKSEEKDRLHSLNHYRHQVEELRTDVDLPSDDVIHQQETLREQTLDHMEIINQRINQAVDMLSRQPTLQTVIRKRIAEYLESFEDLNVAISNTLLSLPESDNREILSEEKPAVPPQPSEQELVYEEMSSKDDVKDDKPVVVEERPDIVDEKPVAEEEHGFGVIVDAWDDETMEDEHNLEVHQLPMAQVQHADHMSDNKMHVKMDLAPKVKVLQNKEVNSVYNPGATAAVAIAAIAVFVIIIVAAMSLRRRSSRRGFLPVSQQPAAGDVSPEERHVANMQMNGYENPTYKYFEMNASKA